MRTLNLGILAHVDAGKTTLTERLLYAAGIIEEIGSVDKGSTQTDSLALEQKRGITIKSAVVSFEIDGVTVNLIDTPGHPDFIAEVERVLNVLDGAILVISAVEGVQAQTRILMRTLARLRIPTLIFVNKIDRGGAQHARTLEAISEKLTPAIVPMGSTTDLGTRGADFTPYAATDQTFQDRMIDLLGDRDPGLLAAYVEGGAALPYARLHDQLAAQTKQAIAHPVFFGSAITGAGLDPLMAAIPHLLPATEGEDEGPVSGTIFKVGRGPTGEKVAYVRMFSGTVRVRDVVHVHHDRQKVTAISVFDRGSDTQSASIVAGQIGKLWGLGDVQIGDSVGTRQRASTQHLFAPPTLETAIVPRHPSEKGALHIALVQLAEQDPLINLRQDDVRGEMFLSLYGEVQKEVVEETLVRDFGIEVAFRETHVICIERPLGTGMAVEVIGKADNPFHGTVGLRIEPAAVKSGVQYELEVELGSLPLGFHRAVEEAVRESLLQGIHGWQVTDCKVAMTHSGYWAPSSTAGDFRNLTPLVVMSALQQAGTAVLEPIHDFQLEVPSDTLGQLLGLLGRLQAVPRTPVLRGPLCRLEGQIPAARVQELRQQLPGLSRGEGVLECVFSSYLPVRGAIPSRARTDHNPLNRKEYLVHVLRRL